ncbi:hypothetical protein ACUW97_002418, partial [Kocuria rhizophila]
SSHPRETSTSIRPPTRRPAARRALHPHLGRAAILLDNNNRKTIARLHFNRSQKYVGLLDENKVETRHAVDTLEQIYDLSDELRATVTRLNA